MQNRIKYIDVAKFIGIFCIYLGHFGDSAGYAYNFVFIFHVPLFFFLSGLSENLTRDIPLHKYVVKNVKNILIPCYLFAIISVVLQCIFTNTYAEVSNNLIQIFKGCIRNHFFAGGVWFLTCLFVIKIVFYILRKLLKYKALLLIVSFAFYLVAQLVINPLPIISPHMPYNIDSACYYIVFYALGYCCSEIVRSFLMFDNVLKRVIGVVIGVFSLVFSAFLFFGKNFFYYLGNLGTGTTIFIVASFINPIIVILLVLIVSRLMENVNVFVELGKDTLFLCGSEYMVKELAITCLHTIGLGIAFPNPVSAYIYTFALLFLCYKFLIPVEKSLFKKLRLLK